LIGGWEVDVEGGAFTGEAFIPNTAAVEIDQRAGDEQTQTSAVGSGRARGPNTPKRLEEPGLILRGNADAVVRDADLQITWLCC
jgi:hypothetical protein